MLVANTLLARGVTSILVATVYTGLLVSWPFLACQDGVILLGSKSFLEATKSALRLLQHQDAEAYEFVTEHLDVIVAGPSSRVYPELPLAICTIGSRARQAGETWYASCLAHEAYHVYLRDHPSGRLTPWRGEDAEERCVAYQRYVILRIGGSPALRQYLDGTVRLRYWEVHPLKQDW